MALMIELWGASIIYDTPEEFKERIRKLPPIWTERKTYLMHEYQNIKPHQWTVDDYKDIGIMYNI